MKPTGLQELNAAVALATHRNFRLAAHELGMSRSTLSHLIAVLETRVGVRLFNRTTRSVSLSEAGEAFLARVRPALQDIDEAMVEAGGFRTSPRGTLRISTCEAGARALLDSVVIPYTKAFPEMTVDLVTDGKLVDIVAEGFDAGVQAPENVPLDMIAIPCGEDRQSVVVASRTYLDGRSVPTHPEELKAHECIRRRDGGAAAQRWAFSKGEESLALDVSGSLVLYNRNVILDAAVAGGGIAYVSADLAAPYIASGRLVELLSGWVPPLPRLSFYYPCRRHIPAGLAAFVAHIFEDNRRRVRSGRPGDFGSSSYNARGIALTN
jgi:DNA-binding transcriptional LysR family regulator